MSQEIVNNGDSGLEARNKINNNFSELVAELSRSIYGFGNLSEWFTRQFNNYTNSEEVGANKRVGICLAGDSLSARALGWLSLYSKRSFGKFDGSGLYGGGALTYFPTGNITPAGLFYTTTGDVVATSDLYTYWPGGNIFDVGNGDTITWPQSVHSRGTLLKAFVIKEPGAGTVVIEYAERFTPAVWNTIETINCNDTLSGHVTSATVTEGQYQIRARVTSGRVKVIGAYIGWPTNIQGFDGFAFGKGGLSVSQFCQADPAVYTPVLSSLNPGLIALQFDDGLSEWENSWDTFLDIVRAGNPRRSVLIVANGPRLSDGDVGMIAVRDFLKSRVIPDNIAVFDMFSLVGPWSRLVEAGWEGDGIHVDQRAYAYVASVLQQVLFINPMFQRIAQDVRNSRVETDHIGLGGESYPTNPPIEIVANTQFGTGGEIKFIRDLNFMDKTGVVQRTMCANPFVFVNQEPAQVWSDNLIYGVPTTPYTSKTTGVTEYTRLNGRWLRNEKTNKELAVGPYAEAATLTFSSIPANSEATLTVTVTDLFANSGTSSGWAVNIGWDGPLEDGIIVKQAWVSGVNTVSIRFRNVTAGPITPANRIVYLYCCAVFA